MNIVVLLGPPGVGKGTQAEIISAKLGIPAISTGQIFRDNVESGTELGVLASGYLDQGEYVPDVVTTSMVSERLDQDDVAEGFLLDGFPRTLSQVSALETLLDDRGWKITAVISLEAPEHIAVEHMTKRAKDSGRSDDKPEVFRKRLDVYHERTEPIVTHYQDRGLLYSVDASGTIPEVSANVFTQLEAAGIGV